MRKTHPRSIEIVLTLTAVADRVDPEYLKRSPYSAEVMTNLELVQ